MKHIGKIVLGMVMGAGLMLGYNFLTSKEANAEYSASHLNVYIVNHSTVPLECLTIEDGTYRSSMTNLEKGDRIYKRYSISEGASGIVVEFKGGKKLFSDTTYVEGGYTLEHAIFDDRIVTHLRTEYDRIKDLGVILH